MLATSAVDGCCCSCGCPGFTVDRTESASRHIQFTMATAPATAHRSGTIVIITITVHTHTDRAETQGHGRHRYIVEFHLVASDNLTWHATQINESTSASVCVFVCLNIVITGLTWTWNKANCQSSTIASLLATCSPPARGPNDSADSLVRKRRLLGQCVCRNLVMARRITCALSGASARFHSDHSLLHLARISPDTTQQRKFYLTYHFDLLCVE